MKLYYLEQDVVEGYDTYSDCVVCAENEDEARKIHPSEFVTHCHDGMWLGTYSGSKNFGEEYETIYDEWVNFKDIDKIRVTELGEAKEGLKKGVICASFHAG